MRIEGKDTASGRCPRWPPDKSRHGGSADAMRPVVAKPTINLGKDEIMDKSPVGVLQAYLSESRSALAHAETEMRYAGWNTEDPENVGRITAYQTVCRAINIAETGDPDKSE